MNKKKILKNPVNEYDNVFHNNKNAEVSQQLEELTKSYTQLKSKLKNEKLFSQQTSKKIGEAKKNNQPVDELLAQMKEKSLELKNFTKEIKNIEEKILSFFEEKSKPSSSNQEDEKQLNQRSYKLQEIYPDKLSIDVIEDSNTDWDDYIQNNSSASIYHKLKWKKLIHNNFSHKTYYLLAKNENHKPVGILPLIRLNSRLFGDFMVSVPYFNYGGAIGDHPMIEKMLIKQACQLGKELKVSHIEFRDDIQHEEYPARTDKVNMLLQLPDSIDALWKGFTPKLRAQIKRPQKENTQMKKGGLECLDDFYTVFSRNMRDLGTPVYGKSFFKSILQEFPDNTTIITIHLNNKPVSAAFLIGYKNRLEIPWASSIKNVNHLSINMLLYWEVLSYAIQEGYDYFDFGRSSKGANTYKFKKQWGAKPQQLYWHYWLNDGNEMPSLNPNNPKYALIIKIWKLLPIFITKLIGPFIVKNLP